MALGLIPSPPTDSLYKFLALAGILVCAASLYLPDELASRVEQQQEEVQTQAAVIVEREARLKDRLDQLGKFIDSAIAKQQGTYRSDPAKLELTFSEVELKALLDRQASILEDVAVSVEQLKGSSRRVERLQSRATHLHRLGIVGSWGGGVVGVLGLALWYVKIQRHEDHAARRRGDGDQGAPD